MVPRNSMAVTSAPSLWYTEPSSKPMTPAPMTSIFLGTDFSERAPVDVMICCSSNCLHNIQYMINVPINLTFSICKTSLKFLY